VFQAADGTYTLTPTFSWTGNPEGADSGDPLHVQLGDEFKFGAKDLVAVVDGDAWVHRDGVSLT
jgi:hypothetical protein